jgi:hypothetical protein
MVPVEKDQGLFVNDNEECIDQLTVTIKKGKMSQ